MVFSMHSPFPKIENIEKDTKRLYLLLFCISPCSMIFVFAQSVLQMSNYPPSVTTVTVDRDKQAWKVNPNLQSNVTAVRNYIVNRLAWMDDSWYDPLLLTDVTLLGSTLWKDGSWNTICLPFRLASLEGTPLEEVVVKTLVSSDFQEGTLTLNFTKGSPTSLEAGRPDIPGLYVNRGSIVAIH